MALLKRNDEKMKCDGQKCAMESVEEDSSIGERFVVIFCSNLWHNFRGAPIKTKAKAKAKKDGKKAKTDEKKAKSRACTLL